MMSQKQNGRIIWGTFVLKQWGLRTNSYYPTVVDDLEKVHTLKIQIANGKYNPSEMLQKALIKSCTTYYCRTFWVKPYTTVG